MSLTESIVEDAALTWFGEQPRCARTLIPAFSQGEKEAAGPGSQMAPGEAAAEREPERSADSRRQSFGEVVQPRFARTLTRPLPPAIFAPLRFPWGEVRREALRQLNLSISQSRTLATLRDRLLPKLLSGELSVAGLESKRNTFA